MIMDNCKSCEFLIIGAGIVGLTLQENWFFPVPKIYYSGKRTAGWCHASGRNSGILHAGIYYPPDTLKAKLCLQGNLLLQKYCEEKGLPLKKTGKVIVARNESELKTLNELYERAQKNGAKVDLIDEKVLQTIEPFAKTHRLAIYSHYTACVDNRAILQRLYQDLLETEKVRFMFDTRFVSHVSEKVIGTNRGKFTFDYFINSAGAYADKVAHSFGLAKNTACCHLKVFIRS